MENDLPDDFELIVVGTGMIESIVAAAASRIGKKVLHIDSNDFYGGQWASFNLEGIEKYVINPQVSSNSTIENISQYLKEGEEFQTIGNNLFGICNVSHAWHIPKEQVKESKQNNDSKTDRENEKNDKSKENAKEKEQNEEIVATKDLLPKDDEEWTQAKFLKNSRKFNLDLAPKLQFARGEFVELLISSNIARYSEYRSVSRVLTWLNGQLEVVPCSRSDVFSNTRVSVVEKRMLMKLLSICMDGDDTKFNDYQNKTFYTYLKDKKLTPNLIHYVLYAISMSTDKTSCLEGIENTKRFLNSLGRFGKTPFLFSMYGSGELPQAFCRLCAVFGGTYCLNRPVNSLIFDANDKCSGVICGTQRINADNVVISVQNVPDKFANSWKKQGISRAIFITDRSILPCEKENLTLLLFPPENGKKSITVIELGPATGTCPQDLYIVHMYCEQASDPKKDFEHCVNKLLNIIQTEQSIQDEESKQIRPNVLWSLYFTVMDTVDCNATNGLSENIYPCPGPDLDLDYDESVKKAKDIFIKMYPDCEFLPRAPDPEEIILCEDETKEIENLPTESELAENEESKEALKRQENKAETNNEVITSQ